MKKTLMLALLCASLTLTACTAAAPEPTASPTAVPTAELTEKPTAEPTAEPTPTPTPAPRFAAGEETVYILCEGKSDGAKALSRWLRSEGQSIAESFVPDGLDAPMYTFLQTERAAEEIPAATAETRCVIIAADTELLESGILAAWLPAFESAAGYIAEVYAGDEAVLAAEAASGTADVLIVKKNDASALGGMAQYPLRYDFVSTIYSVAGKETP